MVFSSIEFLFRFLPVFIIAYLVVKEKYRPYVLLLGSLVFYAYGEHLYVLLMLASIVINHLIAKKISLYRMSEEKTGLDLGARCKGLLVLACLYNFGMLFIFKYLGFFCSIINSIARRGVLPIVKLHLPLGISFYTFMIMSYVIDVYRRKIRVGDSLISFATYVTLFPKLTAGPITTYSEIKSGMKDRRMKPAQVESGVTIFIIGLLYKVLLANKIASLGNDINTVGVYGLNFLTAWMGAWGYSFQIYFDFWGYSLMAIGLGKIFGFKLPQNFKEPYSSRSATEFWRRWHITLGRWFREYVYIPLGGSRRGPVRLVLSSFVVWLLTGLWHGASWNFIIWGLMFFVLLMLEKFIYLDKLESSKWAGHVYMLFWIPLSWTIFKITNLKDLGLYLRKMFFIPMPEKHNISTMPKFIELFGRYWWLLLICAFFSTPLPMKLIKKYRDTIVFKLLLIVGFWYAVYQISQGADNPFLYFRF